MSNFDLILVIIALIIIIVLAICLVHYVNNHKNIDDDKDDSNQVPVIPDVPLIQAFKDYQELSSNENSQQIVFDTVVEQHNINISEEPTLGSVFTVEEDGTYYIEFQGNFSYYIEDAPNELWIVSSIVQVNYDTTTKISGFTYKSTGSNTAKQSASGIIKLNKGDKITMITSGINGNGLISNVFVHQSTFTMYRVALN